MPELVVTRHVGETIVVRLPDGRPVTVRVLRVRPRGGRPTAAIGVEAPADVPVLRGEALGQTARPPPAS